MDAFVVRSRESPNPLFTSQEIRDRGSIFVAFLYKVTSQQEAQRCVSHTKHVVHSQNPASHEISAWRCMQLKKGCTGLGGPDDFELISGSKDDGERWGGERILKVMQNRAVIDAVVIVSRWFGGTLLGPARFSHIETCATEVCQEYKRKEELNECISTLTSLDGVLEALREEYKDLVSSQTADRDARPSSSPTSQPTETKIAKDYTSLDIAKAKRLIKARQNAINSVKLLLGRNRPKNATPPATETG